MTNIATRDSLIAELEASVRDTLAYFDGPGSTNSARIAAWGAWEVLAHFVYWHDATAWGIASAARGGPPWQLSGSADETNAASLEVHRGEDFVTLVGGLRQAQARLVRVARDATDLSLPAFQRPEGAVSAEERLATIARHWRSHLDTLRAADRRD
jgi:hypothetical protein